MRVFAFLSHEPPRDLTDQKTYSSEPGTKLFKPPLNSPSQERSQNLLALLEESIDPTCLIYLIDVIPDEKVEQKAYQKAIQIIGEERLSRNRHSQR